MIKSKSRGRRKKTEADYIFDFLQRIYPQENGCWDWDGQTNKRGCGIVSHGYGVKHTNFIYAHRYAYMLFVGPIPEELIIHHECKNRKCVNPKHLRLMVHGEHTRHHNLERT